MNSTKIALFFALIVTLSGCAAVSVDHKKGDDHLKIKAAGLLKELNLEKLTAGSVTVEGLGSDSTAVAKKAVDKAAALR